MVWGKQDPHVPTTGRQKIYQQLMDSERTFTWYEVSGKHAFMRDEGDRYDPALAFEFYAKAVALFKNTLHKS